MLVFQGEKLFLGQRAGSPEVWQFPQGGVEEDASLEENVFRELEEELGAPRELFRIEKKLQSTHEYDFDNPPEYAKGKWRGQSQTFFLVEFLGKNSDIRLDKDQKPELSSFCWCRPEQVREKAEPKRQSGYEGPLREFEEFLTS